MKWLKLSSFKIFLNIMLWYVEIYVICKELCVYFLNVVVKCEKVVMYSNNKNEKDCLWNCK